MRFEWDDEKNVTNIRKHGLDFADVAEAFDSPMAIAYGKFLQDRLG